MTSEAITASDANVQSPARLGLKHRRINVTFQLGTGDFGEGGFDTLEITGHRVLAKVVKAGGRSMSSLQLRVYGMTMTTMNQLSTLGMVATLQRRNTVTVKAGSDEDGFCVVFVGTIVNGYVDFQASPEVAFHVEAYSGVIEAVKPIAPFSLRGPADVATIMRTLADQANLLFENNGVTAQLASPYFAGSAREQMLACAEAANIEWLIDNGKLAIWPKGASRKLDKPVSVSPATGLVGYPDFTSKGVRLKTLFNGNLRLGDKVNVKSSLTPACGDWVIFDLNHDLEAEIPGGQWFSSISAARPGQVVVP